jgi:hypothetical protein
MNLNQWAIKWGVSYAAVEDLRRGMGVDVPEPVRTDDPKTEADVQARVRLEACSKGCRLWRNNLGAVHTDDGRFIRYGLANDTKAMNTKIKSSDLIGIRPVEIRVDDIGRVIGQFVAREVKPEDWRYTGTDREQAQLNFLNLVLSMGGDAAFTTGEGSL